MDKSKAVLFRSWIVCDSIVVTIEDAERMTRRHYPDHEVVDFQTEDDIDVGMGFKARWSSRLKGT